MPTICNGVDKHILYRITSRLFIANGGEMKLVEGPTQGDTLAMQFYGVSIITILNVLKLEIPSVSQVWLADDASGAGKLGELFKWWKMIIHEGQKYGYFVKPSKSWLILKDPSREAECIDLFETSKINISITGKKHLGAALGTDA